MKIFKKLIVILIFFIIGFSLCGFINKSAYEVIFEKPPLIVVKPPLIIVKQQFIIKDLYIPKIAVNSNIYPDMSYLDKEICYWRNAIIGHNNNKTGFNKLILLQIGDILYHKNIEYVLSEIIIVNKEQGAIVVNSKYPIILFTCYYIKNQETQRLVLFFDKN